MGLFYSVYGLRLSSNLPIPGLISTPHPGDVDVKIRLGSMPPWLPPFSEAAKVWSVGPNLDEHGCPTRMVWQLGDGEYFRYRYSDGTEFILDRAGTEVWASWADDLTLEDTATYLLGPILGFLLRLRGLICLHAGAVVVGESVVALLGPAGAGKS